MTTNARQMTQYDHRDGKQGATFFVKWSRIESVTHIDDPVSRFIEPSESNADATNQWLEWSEERN